MSAFQVYLRALKLLLEDADENLPPREREALAAILERQLAERHMSSVDGYYLTHDRLTLS